MSILEKEGKSQRILPWHVIFFRRSEATVILYSAYRDGARSARSNLLYVRPRTQCFLIVAFPSTSRSLYSYRIAVVGPFSRGQSDGTNGTEGKGASGSWCILICAVLDASRCFRRNLMSKCHAGLT
ncbi:hypothetical protein ALC56_04772 [Trachymyrmex septentrionalis]|uniref:Uncharacterized protein n=1 Tax=Trachymyrmex septentrionalis TaxID=34720 RepID=A0A195FKK1_9HYME|nr:hypothetical protein ALC56_04772 [Trachymyrmex septentrionalis]